MIVIPGDLFYNKVPAEGAFVTQEQEAAVRLLEECTAVAPTFFSMGNHESLLCYEDWERIVRTGVRVLDNEWTQFENVWVGGVTSHMVMNRRAYVISHQINERYPGDLTMHAGKEEGVEITEPDLSWVSPVPKGYTILLDHHPEHFPMIPKEVDLIISGHAHGGQWRLFGRGVYAFGQGILPKWTSGVYEGRMVVTRGLTNTARIPRINNPTEIVYIVP